MSEHSSTGPIQWRRLLLVLSILACGVGAYIVLIHVRPTAKRAPPKERSTVVETMVVQRGTYPVQIQTQGEVIPAVQTVLQAEVAGRIVWQSPQLVPGGWLAKGAVLARLDERDYALLVEHEKAAVERARVEFELEKGRKAVAAREWEIMADDPQLAHHDSSPESRARALREPQLRAAEVTLQGAESALERARLSLERTVLRAPFNALVLSENVDVGQLVGPQTLIATLAGTDQFWVQISLPVDSLPFIDVPPPGASRKGATARIWQQLHSTKNERRGEVVRLLGDLDPAGRMARILVAIDDPLGLASASTDVAPLLLGSYVHVEIAGRSFDNVFQLPRAALGEDNEIFVLNENSRLEIVPTKVLWRTSDTVLADAELPDTARIIKTRLPTPVPGMLLQPKGGHPQDDPSTVEHTAGAAQKAVQ